MATTAKIIAGTMATALLALAVILALSLSKSTTVPPNPVLPTVRQDAEVLAHVPTGFLCNGCQNGRLPGSVRAPIYDNGTLNKGAAASWNTMAFAAHHYLRAFIDANGQDASYRTYARQVYYKVYWCSLGACGNAATPGFSNHGWGRAVDLGNCSMRSVISRIGSRYGWYWGEAPGECWHVTFYGGFHRPDPGPSLAYPHLVHGSGGYGQSFEVVYVQRLLRYHRIPVPNTAGFFTAGLSKSVRSFQRRRHIHQTGTVNRTTWIALRNRRR